MNAAATAMQLEHDVDLALPADPLIALQAVHAWYFASRASGGPIMDSQPYRLMREALRANGRLPAAPPGRIGATLEQLEAERDRAIRAARDRLLVDTRRLDRLERAMVEESVHAPLLNADWQWSLPHMAFEEDPPVFDSLREAIDAGEAREARWAAEGRSPSGRLP